MDEREANLKTEVNKYTDDAIAKIPTSAIRHMQSGTVSKAFDEGNDAYIFVSLTEFLNKDKIIAFFLYQIP